MGKGVEAGLVQPADDEDIGGNGSSPDLEPAVRTSGLSSPVSPVDRLRRLE
jgi:hypothetical protein